MSQGSSEDIRSRSNPQAKSALISTGICAVALTGFYFLGGKQALQSARTTAKVQQDQASAQELINQNSSHVEGILQELESVRSSLANSDEHQLNAEELRQRLTQIEQSLSTLPRVVDETRSEIDAASSRNALQNAEQIAVLSLADKCEQALTTMKESTVAWVQDYGPLLTNDLGRKIAVDENSVQAFATAVAGEFPAVKDSIDWMAEFKAAVRPIREADANGITNYRATAADRAYLETLLSRVNASNERLQRRRRAVDVILATTSNKVPGKLTLAQSIEELDSQTMRTMIAEATRVRKQELQKAIDEQSAAILKAENERIAAETRLRVQQEQMSTNAATRQAESQSRDEALLQAQNQRKQLEKQFELEQAKIKLLLGTFLGRGRFEPIRDFSLDTPYMRLMDEPGLLSLGRLASIGALDQTDDGYELLYRIGGSIDNDRRKSGFPNYISNGLANPTAAAKVKRTSELLNQYGDLLIEKRLIAK